MQQLETLEAHMLLVMLWKLLQTRTKPSKKIEIPVDFTLVDKVSPVKTLSTNIEIVSELQNSVLSKTSIELSRKLALESDEYNSMFVKRPNNMRIPKVLMRVYLTALKQNIVGGKDEL